MLPHVSPPPPQITIAPFFLQNKTMKKIALAGSDDFMKEPFTFEKIRNIVSKHVNLPFAIPEISRQPSRAQLIQEGSVIMMASMLVFWVI
jgi:hypothetical protein